MFSFQQSYTAHTMESTKSSLQLRTKLFQNNANQIQQYAPVDGLHVSELQFP